MHLSTAQVNQLKSKALGLRAQLARIKGNTKQMESTTIALIETVGTSFAVGLVTGRAVDPHVMGVPYSALIGVPALAAGLMGIAPEHMMAVGSGALSYLAGEYGHKMGVDMAAKAHGAG